ncbi:hypothetical protein J8M21_20745 [Pseudoalteromonas luteoviolacea]|nr:ATP-binding protein [Pseudoalteromonas luteoviolacea]MBQ4879650.1 hypothetical protein [Pseudoalteromonas luteoviolacea]MBQ4908676.1 hypothetical protein [Pseudoalteromonas luteoviolacea]
MIILFCSMLSVNTFAYSKELNGFTYGITQDSNGYIYVATHDGGYRLDGTHKLQLSTLFQLPEKWLEDVRYLENKNLLILAYGDEGIKVVDLNSNKVFSYQEKPCLRLGIHDNLISCRNGTELNSWLVKDRSLQSYNLFPDETEVHALSDGYIYTDKGLFRIKNNKYKLVSEFLSDTVRMTSNKHGVLVWQNKTLTFYGPHDTKVSIEWPTLPKTLLLGESEAFIENNGLVQQVALFDLRVFSTINNSNASTIRRIFLDTDNNTWLVKSNGYSVYSDTFKTRHLPIASDYNIKISSENGTFIGTEKGVFKKSDTDYSILGNPSSYGYVVTDLDTYQNSLLISSVKGLYRYEFDTKRLEKIYDKYVVATHVEQSLAYIATSYDGLVSYDGSQVKEIADINAVMDEKEVIQVDVIEDVLYVGTASGFLTKNRQGEISKYADQTPNISGFEKLNEEIYISSFGSGLYKFTNDKLQRVPGPSTISELKAVKGSLYIGTNNGLYRSDGHNTELVPNTLGLNITANSMHDSHTEVHFGSQIGVNQIELNRSNKVERVFVSSIVTEGLSTFKNAFNKHELVQIKLATNQFTDVTFYQYSLDGRSWHDAKAGTIAVHNFEPDTYTVFYRARYRSSEWSAPHEITLKISGKWYETKLAITVFWITLLLIILGLSAVFTLILRANHRVHDRLKLLYNQTNVQELLTKVLKAKGSFSSGDANNYADGLVYIDEVLDTLVPVAHNTATLGNRTLIQGIKALEACFKYEAPSTAIEIVLSTSHNASLSNKLEVDVYSVVYHALSNAVKHGKASNIQVNIEQLQGYLHLSVKDDGQGFSLKKQVLEFGLGIYTMRQVAAAYKSKLKIKSGNKGSEVSIVFPILDLPETPKKSSFRQHA